MAFNMKGSPMHRNFGIGSPAKQTKPDEEGEKKIIDKRLKDVEDARKKRQDFQDKVKNVVLDTQDKVDRVNTQDSLNVVNINDLVDKYEITTDSIKDVHNRYNKKNQEDFDSLFDE
tara:strand:- start:2645 stop:2992 length:348 start_codon:yes stop_codon:yes gene_type:complete